MSKSWQLLVIIAFILLAFYTGFEIYNSITGSNTEFKGTITPIKTDLGQETLDHINLSINTLNYKGDIVIEEDSTFQEFEELETE